MSINLEAFKSLAGVQLDNFAPKPTSVEGDQQEAHKALWTSPDGALEVGVWECAPGKFVTERLDSSEICHFISGKLEIRDTDGIPRMLGPGDMVVLPTGWKGEWTLHESVRKLYFIFEQ